MCIIVEKKKTSWPWRKSRLISIWRSGARFDRARGSVRAWTLGIVRNRAIDFLRRDAGRAPKLARLFERTFARLPFGLGGFAWFFLPVLDRKAARDEPSRVVNGLGVAALAFIAVMTILGYVMP